MKRAPRSLIRPFTRAGRVARRNRRYDDQTAEIIRRVLGPTSNAVDVGCFKGKILADIVRQAPDGRHVACEPNPELAADLRRRFPGVAIREVALSDAPGRSQFHVLLRLPARSSLLLQPADHHREARVVDVAVETLDRLLPVDVPVHLIKIDVEGAEVKMLAGARDTLRRWRPVVVFEHGVGSAAAYDTTPEMLFDLLSECGLQISLVGGWLGGAPALDRRAFLREKYEVGRHWMFVAHP